MRTICLKWDRARAAKERLDAPCSSDAAPVCTTGVPEGADACWSLCSRCGFCCSQPNICSWRPNSCSWRPNIWFWRPCSLRRGTSVRCRRQSRKSGHCKIVRLKPGLSRLSRHGKVPAALSQQTTCTDCFDAQAIFCRRRHQPRRPPLAKIRPNGRAAPGMGTAVGTRDAPAEIVRAAGPNTNCSEENPTIMGEGVEIESGKPETSMRNRPSVSLLKKKAVKLGSNSKTDARDASV